MLLDTSSSALDALSQMKKSISDLKSALRRGSNDEGIPIYVMSRKKVCKALSKCLANLKKAKRKCALPQPETVSDTVKMLKEAETISLLTLKSLFSYVMGKKVASQTHGWSLALSALSEIHSGAETKAVLRQLDMLETVVLELEDGLPSISHPLNASIESHFSRVRALQSESSSSSSIYQNFCNMKDLYQQVDNLIHLPHNQQALSCDHHRKVFEGVLDGSLALLDTSSSALDALSQMKKSISDLKSALRRGNNDEGIPVYVMSRKKVCKALSQSALQT
ncbi:Indole-3-glycerol phosphate synthase [Bienertia sinuspersici]